MIKVELGHLGVMFDCDLSRVCAKDNCLWLARVKLPSGDSDLVGQGKSPVLAIEALRNKFHEEEK